MPGKRHGFDSRMPLQKGHMLFFRRSDKYIIKKYKEAGTEFGDAVSYLGACGECVGFRDMLDKWEKWEKKVAERGYRTLPIEVFSDAGGWGVPLPTLFKREYEEEPTYHAARYRKRWLGKSVITDMTLHENGAVSGHYIRPFTGD